MPQRVPVIQCDKELLMRLSTTLQFAITGKPVWYSDNLADLVKRHCPEIYDIAKEAGFRFIPSTDAADLTYKPPRIWFDVIRDAQTAAA
jgi:hypothetical protein